MMSGLLQLESFDDSFGRSKQFPKSESKKVDYEDGYVAGVAAAEANMAESHAQMQAELAQSLQNATLTVDQAQKQLLSGLSPLLNSILSVVLPKILLPAFYANIQDALSQALEEVCQPTLCLRVSPDQATAVADLIATWGFDGVTVQSDPRQTPHAAWIISAEGEVALDLDAALHEMADTLRAALSSLNLAEEVS